MKDDRLYQILQTFLYDRGYLDSTVPPQDDELLILDSLDYLSLSLDIEKALNLTINDTIFFADNPSLSDTLDGFYTRLSTACHS